MAFTGIQSASDISAALRASVEGGGLVIDEKDLNPDFFDLKTGFAGQVLQKFVSYRTKLAVIVRDPSVHGGRFGELMHEHRIHPIVRFFSAEQSARQWLSQMPSGKVRS
jgi:PadR family transcriptional regulator, regulatory protein AphA